MPRPRTPFRKQLKGWSARVLTRRPYGYYIASTGSIITLIMLFRPWVTAASGNGKAEVNAFGRLTFSTKFLTIFSQQRSAAPNFSAMGGVLSCVTILITCLAVLMYARVPTAVMAGVIAVGSVLTAILAVIVLLYLNSKLPQMVALVGRRYDLGGMVGNVMAWMGGKSLLPLPGLHDPVTVQGTGITTAAFAAIGSSVTSAMAAVVQWFVDNPQREGRLFSRLVDQHKIHPLR